MTEKELKQVDYLEKVTSRRVWYGGIIPTVIICMAILLPALFFPQLKGEVYSVIFCVFILLILVSFSLFSTISVLKKYSKEHGDSIGWCVRCCISYSIPISFIINIGVLDSILLSKLGLSKLMDFNMSYIVAGAIIYYALRLQAKFLSKHKWILPMGIILATLIVFIFDENSVCSLLVGGLVLIVTLIVLYGRVHASTLIPLLRSKNVCPDLTNNIESLDIESDEMRNCKFAFAIIIRDYLYQWSFKMGNLEDSDAILAQIVPLQECFSNPKESITKMLNFNRHLRHLYWKTRDKYYNLDTISLLIKEECVLLRNSNNLV